MTQASHLRKLSMATALSLVLSAPAMGQANEDEIIVTATKRATTIQDVPFSIAAVTEQDIIRTGAVDLEDISRNVAGLTIQNLGPGQSQVAIRGVSAGQIVRDQPGVKEQVGIYLDESVISLSLFTPDLDLFDLNRVETLRGPQGTLFGSGSVGGTIRFITNQPNLENYEAKAEVDVHSVTDGDVGGSIKGAINAPFADGKAALRAVGYFTQYAGFIDALREGGGRTDDVNDGTRFGGRVALTFEPTESLSITPRIIYQEIDSNGFNRQEVFNLFANPTTTTRTPISLQEREQFLLLDEEFTDETFIADLTINASLTDSIDLTSVSSFSDRDILVSRDASALTGSVSVDLGFPDEAVLLPSNLRDTTDLQTFSQEVRLASTSDGPLQWVVGAFYSDVTRDYAQRLPTSGFDSFTDQVLGAGTSAAVANGFGTDSPFNSDLDYDLEQFAVFGEGSYDLTDRFTLTAGLRYYDFEETRTITTGGLFAAGDSNVVDETSSDGFTPRFLASYDLSDAWTWNAQVSRGFRLGGVNDPLNVALCSAEDEAIFGNFQAYDDETLWNYETGVKYSQNGVRFNAAVFYTDISNLQATLDAGSCSSRVVFNVPDAHTTGVEFELAAPLGDVFEFGVSGSLINAEFDSDVVDGTGTILAGLRDGNELPSVPDFQLSLQGTYLFDNPLTQEEGGYFTVSAQHVGSRFTQPGDQEPGANVFVSNLPFGGSTGTGESVLDLELDSYQILNINTGLEFDNWDLQLYVNNILDTNADLSFDRERGGRARLAFRTNRPRTVGLRARYTY